MSHTFHKYGIEANFITIFSTPMIEFEFKNLSLNVTSRPRSSSHIIELCLGAIYLKDKFTLNTIFPVLVGPPGHDRTPLTRSRGPSPRVSVASKPEDLFSLVYEKCATNSGCDYRYFLYIIIF